MTNIQKSADKAWAIKMEEDKKAILAERAAKKAQANPSAASVFTTNKATTSTSAPYYETRPATEAELNNPRFNNISPSTPAEQSNPALKNSYTLNHHTGTTQQFVEKMTAAHNGATGIGFGIFAGKALGDENVVTKPRVNTAQYREELKRYNALTPDQRNDFIIANTVKQNKPLSAANINEIKINNQQLPEKQRTNLGKYGVPAAPTSGYNKIWTDSNGVKHTEFVEYSTGGGTAQRRQSNEAFVPFVNYDKGSTVTNSSSSSSTHKVDGGTVTTNQTTTKKSTPHSGTFGFAYAVDEHPHDDTNARGRMPNNTSIHNPNIESGTGKATGKALKLAQVNTQSSGQAQTMQSKSELEVTKALLEKYKAIGYIELQESTNSVSLNNDRVGAVVNGPAVRNSKKHSVIIPTYTFNKASIKGEPQPVNLNKKEFAKHQLYIPTSSEIRPINELGVQDGTRLVEVEVGGQTVLAALPKEAAHNSGKNDWFAGGYINVTIAQTSTSRSTNSQFTPDPTPVPPTPEPPVPPTPEPPVPPTPEPPVPPTPEPPVPPTPEPPVPPKPEPPVPPTPEPPVPPKPDPKPDPGPNPDPPKPPVPPEPDPKPDPKPDPGPNPDPPKPPVPPKPDPKPDPTPKPDPLPPVVPVPPTPGGRPTPSPSPSPNPNPNPGPVPPIPDGRSIQTATTRATDTTKETKIPRRNNLMTEPSFGGR